MTRILRVLPFILFVSSVSPALATTIPVSTYGAYPDDGVDDAVAINDAIASAQPGDTGSLAAASTACASATPLGDGFASPPQAARPLVWWHWVNGNVTKEGIDADLDDMKRVGIAGVQMFDVSIYLPPGPVRYGTDIWHEHVQYAIRAAAKRGLEFYMMNTPGWSASGGPWVTPKRSMKRLVWSATSVVSAGLATPAVTLAQPETKLGFYRDVAVLALPGSPWRRVGGLDAKTVLADNCLPRPALDLDPSDCIPRARIVDLTARFDPASGVIRAELPAGSWTILRFGYTSTGSTNHPAVPEGRGLEIDKMDADAVSFYFDHALGRVIREAGPLAGTTFKGILFDSFEGGPQNWTTDFPAQFKRMKGYDLVPLLPVIAGYVVGNTTFTECVLHDFRTAVRQSIADNYFGTMRRRAREHGMVVCAEAQGGPLNPMFCGDQIDVPMNEFWMPDAAPRLPRIKLVASVGHVLGRRIVAAESFTAKPEDGRWQVVPSALKNPGDYAWTAGINRFSLHHYTHQPTNDGPGFGLGRYGTQFGRLNTWWPLAKGWISYVARGQFLLQQGRAVADVCFLQNDDLGYSFPASLVNVPPGFDFDICYPRHLARMTWSHGAFRLPAGPEYRILALPPNWAADVSTLRRLRDFARAGAKIIGPPPAAPSGLADYEDLAEYRSLVAELWGNGGMVSGLVHRISLADALRSFQPDLSLPSHPAPGGFRYIHRQTVDADIYFVFNHSAFPASGAFTFRVRHRRPEFWNAVTGSHADAPVFRTVTGGTAVPLQLEPFGSMFVVFRRPLPAHWVESVTPANLPSENGRLLAPANLAVSLTANDGRKRTAGPRQLPADIFVKGPWRVEFANGRGAPREAAFPSLASWTAQSDPGIKYYSGVAVYHADFNVPADALQADRVAWLDLGAVADIAEISINGQIVRNLWQPPFRTDVTRWLHAGSNTLQIRVANRWINRIIGDENLPTDLKYQAPGTSKFTDGRLLNLPPWLYDRSKISMKKRFSFTTWKHYTAASPPVLSGLLGPVRLEWRAVVAPQVSEAGNLP